MTRIRNAHGQILEARIQRKRFADVAIDLVLKRFTFLAFSIPHAAPSSRKHQPISTFGLNGDRATHMAYKMPNGLHFERLCN